MPKIIHKNRLQQEPFTQMYNFVLDEQWLSNNAKLLYTHLKKFAWGKGSAFPGKLYLAELMKVTPRAVYNYIEELKDCGLVEVVRRGMRETNLYVITDEFDEKWRKDHPVKPYASRKKREEEDDDDDDEITQSPAVINHPVKKETFSRETPRPAPNVTRPQQYARNYTADQLEAISFYQKESRDTGSINAEFVAKLAGNFSLDWFTQAYGVMRTSGKSANHLKYVEGVLIRCKAEGHSPLESTKQKDGKNNSVADNLDNYRAEMQRKYERQKEELGF